MNTASIIAIILLILILFAAIAYIIREKKKVSNALDVHLRINARNTAVLKEPVNRRKEAVTASVVEFRQE